jgi:hypothetical protein
MKVSRTSTPSLTLRAGPTNSMDGRFDGGDGVRLRSWTFQFGVPVHARE